MSEHQIINLLHEIIIVVNAYKIKTNNFDFHVVRTLVIGFTGVLKEWWGHYLNQNDREFTLNVRKIVVKEEGTFVQTYEEDVINILIFAITKYFIRDSFYF